VGRYFFLIIFLICFNGVFVRFSTRGVFKPPSKNLGGNPCQKLLAEKVEILFSCRVFPSISFIAFLAVSLHEEPKNIQIFSKIRPGNLKKSQTKVGIIG
jgi:hypothetical protein